MKSKKQMTLGDELNKLQADAISNYKDIMGEMTDLDATIGLKYLFEGNLPMMELMETLDKQQTQEVNFDNEAQKIKRLPEMYSRSN